MEFFLHLKVFQFFPNQVRDVSVVPKQKMFQCEAVESKSASLARSPPVGPKWTSHLSILGKETE